MSPGVVGNLVIPDMMLDDDSGRDDVSLCVDGDRGLMTEKS